MEEVASLADLPNCSDVFCQTDSVIKIEVFVALNIAKNFFLAEVYKNSVLLYFEAVDFQKNAALVAPLVVLLILHWLSKTYNSYIIRIGLSTNQRPNAKKW